MKKPLLFRMTILAVLFLAADFLQAQVIKPTRTDRSIHHDVSPPVREMKSFVKQDPIMKAEVHAPMKPKKQLPNSDPDFKPDYPVVQDHFFPSRSSANPSVVLDFEGIGRAEIAAKYYPPDTHGDVGPDHFVQAVNSEFKIWDKEGNVLVDHLPIKTLFSAGGFDDGQSFEDNNPIDPVVLYDEYADRWFIGGFTYQTPYYYMLIAVSTTGDPTGSYNRYAWEYVNVVPDYEKFGVWHDGYYMTTNNFPNGSASYAEMRVFDRDAMINGDASISSVIFSLGTDYFGFLPADADGFPPPDTMAHPSLALSRTTPNTLDLMLTRMDWENTANSNVTFNNLSVQEFANGGYAFQPGSARLDGLAGRLMYRLQYRNFGTYHTLVANHTIRNTNSILGVRWYELRDTGDGFGIYQQGTLLPDDDTYRWMGSIAMNGNGDICLGYSVTNTTGVYPSIRFTGQTAGAPEGLGVMDIPETTIVSGTETYIGGGSRYRWGDYSAMTVDPTNDYTFWYTQEYSTDPYDWVTRVARLDLETFACSIPTDLAASNLTINSADLDWTENGQSTSWEILLDVEGFDPTGMEPAEVTAKPYTATSLSANTSYDLYVRSICNNDNTSDWAGPYTFQTLSDLPVAICQDVTVSATSGCQQDVSAAEVDNGSYDPNGVPLTLTLTPAGPYPVGVTDVVLTVDYGTNSSSCDAVITVIDDIAPVVTFNDTLFFWPPNHKYESVSVDQIVSGISDNCDNGLTIDDIVITHVTSDEPENDPGEGDGNTMEDILINLNCKSLQVRRERDENANGRVYTVYMEVTDGNGNIAEFSSQLHVPIVANQVSEDDGMVYEVVSSCSNKVTEVGNVQNLLKDTYSLVNYPNPFTDATTIRFSIGESAYTQLEIYDSMGKKVASLFDGNAEQDVRYELVFQSGNLPKGIYFFHFRSGNSIRQTGKMILMK
ncbi:MAG: T9SS type A sorting domain-containing protein [bacterium]